MKLSEEQLKQIIKEELLELDEGFLDKLLGRDTSSPSIKLRNKIDTAKTALKELYVEAAKQKEGNVATLAKSLLDRLRLGIDTKLGSAYKEVGQFASYMEEELENE